MFLMKIGSVKIDALVFQNRYFHHGAGISITANSSWTPAASIETEESKIHPQYSPLSNQDERDFARFQRKSSPSPPQLPPPPPTPLMSLLTAQQPPHQLQPPMHHPSMLQPTDFYFPPAPATAPAEWMLPGRAAVAQPVPPPPIIAGAIAELAAAAAAAAAAAREDEALRRARALVLATAAEVAAGGGRAAAEAILAATLGPDGRSRLDSPSAGLGPAAGLQWWL